MTAAVAVDWLTGGLGVETEGVVGAVELEVDDEADVVAVEEERGGAIGGA